MKTNIPQITPLACGWKHHLEQIRTAVSQLPDKENPGLQRPTMQVPCQRFSSGLKKQVLEKGIWRSHAREVQDMGSRLSVSGKAPTEKKLPGQAQSLSHCYQKQSNQQRHMHHTKGRRHAGPASLR